ncbi:hypothetical protein CEXT_690241 [Caerostris extrusa]|uniref:Uncharacterized protein n=1 Tax=Caerostris extrusa TaxID=172846 RepID=A0AAV4X170_CAEEX|nr:hypothetical protein CEXT_690241 [Caerostris extrusa]
MTLLSHRHQLVLQWKGQFGLLTTWSLKEKTTFDRFGPRRTLKVFYDLPQRHGWLLLPPNNVSVIGRQVNDFSVIVEILHYHFQNCL